jgi:hypothetical protein
MSQRDVERAGGRVLTDAAFRRDFYRNPVRVCLAFGVRLVPHEVEALLHVPRRPLAELARKLDDRICRLHVEPTSSPTRIAERRDATDSNAAQAATRRGVPAGATRRREHR